MTLKYQIINKKDLLNNFNPIIYILYVVSAYIQNTNILLLFLYSYHYFICLKRDFYHFFSGFLKKILQKKIKPPIVINESAKLKAGQCKLL